MDTFTKPTPVHVSSPANLISFQTRVTIPASTAMFLAPLVRDLDPVTALHAPAPRFIQPMSLVDTAYPIVLQVKQDQEPIASPAIKPALLVEALLPTNVLVARMELS
jgi:hypothetical protein